MKNDCKKFDETSLPKKEDADYAHTKRVCKFLKIGGYHDLCVQSETLLTADVFEKY